LIALPLRLADRLESFFGQVAPPPTFEHASKFFEFGIARHLQSVAQDLRRSVRDWARLYNSGTPARRRYLTGRKRGA
jgi:hypothetical protein